MLSNKLDFPAKVCSPTDQPMFGNDTIDIYAKSYVNKLVSFNFDLDQIYTDQTREEAMKKIVQYILMNDELIKGKISRLKI